MEKNSKGKKVKIDNERAKVVKGQNRKIFKEKTRMGFHFSFGMRLLTNIIIFIILIIGLIFSLNKAFSITKKGFISYKEISDINYKVYLKDNNFYDKPYLEKGMAYVASLIDKIDINYNYKINSSVNSNIDINYAIVAKLVIASQNNNSVFFEKEYELSNTATDEIVDNNNYLLDKEISVDYNYYNDLANQFKSKYAVNTNSRLEVSLIVKEKNKENNSYDLDNESVATLVIPLSEQEVNINMNDNNINRETKITSDVKIIINDTTFVIVSIVITILAIIALISIIKKILIFTKNERSNYDRFIKRILVGYDRIIVNVKTAPDINNYNVIKVESFQELVDVRDNTKEPINYYIIQEHIKSEFYLINNNNLYLYVVKAVDIENNEKNKKNAL